MAITTADFNQLLDETQERLTTSHTPAEYRKASQHLQSLRAGWGDLSKKRQDKLLPHARALGERIRAYEEPKPYIHGERVIADERLLGKLDCSSWRPGQQEAVQAALDNQDSLVVMPTGGGKSLCYQLPALVRPGLTVVVSPLIALMQDQYQRLATMGYPVARLSSSLEEDEVRQVLNDLYNNQLRVIFVAPERFASLSFRNALEQNSISLFVIDEAHCISEWGHDFRPDYLRLPGIITALGRPPVMALTATATPARADEIAERLDLKDPVRILSGFDRPNITFDVIPLRGTGAVARKSQLLLEGIASDDMRPAIVYCGTRKDTESVADYLTSQGLEALAYHAGIEQVTRAERQARFMNGEVDIIVATNAFGMGIDKGDIRSVWHWALPTSIEAYYQEAGRAGRDGQPSRAVLLSMRADLGRLISFNKRRAIDIETVESLVAKLYIQWKREGGLLIDPPEEDTERQALAIAERAGVLQLSPGASGTLKIDISGRGFTSTQRRAAVAAIQAAQEMGWNAYRAVEAFSAKHDTCRRQQILTHFGDPATPEPKVRCCDVCAKIDWIDVELYSDPGEGDAKGKSSKKKTSALARPSIATRAAEVNTANTKVRRAAAGQVPYTGTELDERVDPVFYDDLKEWRKERAGDRPAYTVCSNKALEQIALTHPKTNAELLVLHGIGPGFIDTHATSLRKLLKEAKRR